MAESDESVVDIPSTWWRGVGCTHTQCWQLKLNRPVYSEIASWSIKRVLYNDNYLNYICGAKAVYEYCVRMLAVSDRSAILVVTATGRRGRLQQHNVDK